MASDVAACPVELDINVDRQNIAPVNPHLGSPRGRPHLSRVVGDRVARGRENTHELAYGFDLARPVSHCRVMPLIHDQHPDGVENSEGIEPGYGHVDAHK